SGFARQRPTRRAREWGHALAAGAWRETTCMKCEFSACSSLGGMLAEIFLEEEVGRAAPFRGRKEARRMKKPPPVPCLTLLRTRIDQGAPQHRVLGPTRTSLEGVGMQAPITLLAPSGYSIGSSKATPDHEHRR